MVDLFRKYQEAIERGCDRKCSKCDLWLLSRNECVIEANKKWSAWAKKRHIEFEKVLKEGA